MIKMNDELTLTRYLYFTDEVALSLLDCLIEQRDINEALFWISEFYTSTSDEEAWLLVWKIYFDFYAITNPKIYKKISHYWQNDKSLFNICCIVKNLFKSLASCHVFLFRIRSYSKPIAIYLNKKTNTEKLLKAIKKRHIANIRYYIDKTNDWESVKKYCNEREKSNFTEYPYPESLKFNFMIYYILSHFNLEIPINTRYILHKLTDSENKIVNDFAYDFEKGKKFDVLRSLKRYSISKNIGCFDLNRNNAIVHNKKLLTIDEIYWYHWEYFACKNTIWKTRMLEFNGDYDLKQLNIVFSDDDKLEKFYDKYGLEPDEQTKECHDKSICEIPEYSIVDWINSNFEFVNVIDSKNISPIVDYKN